MISSSNVSAGQASSYYSADDYYTKGQPPAEWLGIGAGKLGLHGQIAGPELTAALHGKLPGIELPGGDQHQRRAATDITISAPKSVSIAALVQGDERVLAAHNHAVKVAAARVQELVQARQTAKGQTETVLTQNAVMAAIRHDTSRAGDPQLHTHLLVLNATQRPDGKWRAIENKLILQHKVQIDQIYKAELSAELMKVGYQLRPSKDGFELGHVSEKAIAEFSARSKAAEAWLAERGLTRETATAKQRQEAVLATRNKKEAYDRDELIRDWRERGKAVGLAESITPTPAPGERNPSQATQPERMTAKQCVDLAKDHLTERESVREARHLTTEALRFSLGTGLRYGEINAELRRQVKAGEILAVKSPQEGKDLWTTKRARDIEKKILAIEKNGRGQALRVITTQEATRIAVAKGLSQEQANAVRLLTSPNLVTAIQGRAGTGKTTTMVAVKEAVATANAEAKGRTAPYQIVGLAPTHSAVKALGEAGIEAQTLQSWLANPEAGAALNTKSVIILDEVGLVGSQALASMLARAEKAGARVLLSGDVKQYQAVESGQPLTQLQRQGMETAEITEMRRQQDASLEVRQAAQLSAEIATAKEALTMLDDAERVHEIKDDNHRREAISEAYTSLPIAERMKALVLTGTNESRQAINLFVRDSLGLADAPDARDVQVFQRGDQTGAEKKILATYEPGQLIKFEKNYKSMGVKAGEVWNVKEVKPDCVVIEKEGKTAEMHPARMTDQGFSLGTLEDRQLATGDRVRFTGTSRDDGYMNGNRGTVIGLMAGEVEVALDSGDTISVSLDQPLTLDHGYAATGHSAQGLGAERVLIDLDTQSLTTDHRSFYTNLTRTKSEVDIWTNSKSELMSKISTAKEKTEALSIPDKSAPLPPAPPSPPAAAPPKESPEIEFEI